MPKIMRDMFKTNRVYDTSALSSFRIDSNVYGRQFTGVRQLYSAANFNTDVTRAVTPAPTFDQIETSSLFYSDFELITTFTNMERQHRIWTFMKLNLVSTYRQATTGNIVGRRFI